MASIPYIFCLIAFASFVVWNGGIVLGLYKLFLIEVATVLKKIYIPGDKSNHVPVLHIPQVYYFVAFATAFAWPVLASYDNGPLALVRDIRHRMFGSIRYARHGQRLIWYFENNSVTDE